MKHRLGLAILFAVFLTTFALRAGAATPDVSGSPADDAAIKRAVSTFSEGWNSHDAHSMCMSLADDVEWVNWRGEAVHTRQEVEDTHAKLFSGLYKNTHRTDTVKAIRYLTPEIASVEFEWNMTGAKRRDGSDWPYREGYVNYLMQKKNGRWVVIMSHTADFNATAPGNSGR